MGRASWGGRAEKAVHLHSVEREIRQLTAELKHIKNQHQATVRQRPVDMSDIGEPHLLLMKSEESMNSIVERGIAQWERRLCREEGMMLKSINKRAC